ncbi:hypothetical protein FOXYSP1_00912 [Fusarium oxysporum f. sp. phaseoli]
MAELMMHWLLTAYLQLNFPQTFAECSSNADSGIISGSGATVSAEGWAPSSRLHRLTPPAAEMIALSVRTWLITQLLGYSYYYCRHTKLRAITQSNINSKLVLDWFVTAPLFFSSSFPVLLRIDVEILHRTGDCDCDLRLSCCCCYCQEARIWLEFCSRSIGCHVSKQSHKCAIINRAALVSLFSFFFFSPNRHLLTCWPR